MITAKRFAGMGSIWHRSTPALEQYIRWVNRNARTYTPLRVFGAAERGRSSLISETGFNLAHESPNLAVAESEAQKFLLGLPGTGQSMPALNAEERMQARTIAANITSFLVQRTGKVTFSPSFPGCGAVQPAVGDLTVGDELVEMKAVQRLFRGHDLRQALTYAALAYSAGESFRHVTLLNPRLGTYHSSGSASLARDVGAGSWVELMQDLVELMTGFDVSG